MLALQEWLPVSCASKSVAYPLLRSDAALQWRPIWANTRAAGSASRNAPPLRLAPTVAASDLSFDIKGVMDETSLPSVPARRSQVARPPGARGRSLCDRGGPAVGGY